MNRYGNTVGWMRAMATAIIAGLIITGGAALPAHASDGSTASSIASLTNGERSERGVKKLGRSASLDRIARNWAKKMASTAEGKCFIGKKGLRHNPNLRGQVPGDWKRVAENVGCGFRASGASGMMRGWMGSSGHKANILNKRFTTVGVGYYTDAHGMTWAVQVFAEYPQRSAEPKKKKSTPKTAAAKRSTAPASVSLPKAADAAAPATEATVLTGALQSSLRIVLHSLGVGPSVLG